MSVQIRPASSLPLAELADLFSRGYRDYLVPIQVDEEGLKSMVQSFDLDLDAGCVAFLDGEPVGLVNLGVRADRGWIGGLAVVPEARRQGIGRALMDAVHDRARAAGIHEIRLEVIEGNDAAFRLYETLGYEFVRMLEIGSLEAAPGDAPEECDWPEAHARIREERIEREPWQREDETLARRENLRGLCIAGGAAVFALDDDRVTVLQHVADEDTARELLEALRALGRVTVFNVPTRDPVVTALRELGGEIAIRQRELALRM